eukprot:GILJ01007274.1.p1 GENE.GILJ01007274.1~~GILJ01007274.1.p1  ORF type:complete len:528 (+),score=80.26 GILJ01007274.1:173-1585(+)
MAEMLHWDSFAALVKFGDLLGAGAFGEVFAVSVEGVGPAAIKRINRHSLSVHIKPWGLEPEALVMEELECGLLLGATPGVVGAAGLFQDEKFFYLLMPLVTPAKTCEDIKDPFELLLLLVSLLNTVERCHAEGVMHRDIREDNVTLIRLEDPARTLGRRGVGGAVVPVLMDFSLGIRAKEANYVFNNFTSDKYIPPEMNADGSRYGPTVDLFAVGAVGEQLLAKVVEVQQDLRDTPFVQQVFKPFCDLLLSLNPEVRLTWREFLLSNLDESGTLYHTSFPSEAQHKKRSNASVTGVSRHVLILKALVEEDLGEIRRCLTRANSINASFAELRAFIESRCQCAYPGGAGHRDSLTFSEGDGLVGYPIDGQAAFLDDGSESFDYQEFFAEFGLHPPPRPCLKEEPIEDTDPVVAHKGSGALVDRDPWAIDPTSSPVKAAMERLDKIAAARARQFVQKYYKSSSTQALAALRR